MGSTVGGGHIDLVAMPCVAFCVGDEDIYQDDRSPWR